MTQWTGPGVGRRIVLARHCGRCGEWRQGIEFGRHGRTWCRSCDRLHRDRHRTHLGLWRTGSRTVLAKTCDTCGVLSPASAFRLVGQVLLHTCLACDPPTSDRRREQKRESEARRRQVSKAAPKNRAIWTGPELEWLLLHEDLPAVEAAKALGRTYSAVGNMRKRLRAEPKYDNAAGLART